jgi:hypothetical protein
VEETRAMTTLLIVMYLPTVFKALYEALVKSIVKSTFPEGATSDSFWHELNVLAPQYTAINDAPFNPNDFKNSFLLILFSMVGYDDRICYVLYKWCPIQ